MEFRKKKPEKMSDGELLQELDRMIASAEAQAHPNPAASAKKEAKKTSPRTNINCPTRSSYRLKYQRPTKGNPQSTIKANTIVETPNWIQNP